MDPKTIGIRFRGFWIEDEGFTSDTGIDVPVGAVCVETRDGESFDADAEKIPGFLGSEVDSSDPTYRYYFFAPAAKADNSSSDKD